MGLSYIADGPLSAKRRRMSASAYRNVRVEPGVRDFGEGTSMMDFQDTQNNGCDFAIPAVPAQQSEAGAVGSQASTTDPESQASTVGSTYDPGSQTQRQEVEDENDTATFLSEVKASATQTGTICSSFRQEHVDSLLIQLDGSGSRCLLGIEAVEMLCDTIHTRLGKCGQDHLFEEVKTPAALSSTWQHEWPFIKRDINAVFKGVGVSTEYRIRMLVDSLLKGLITLESDRVLVHVEHPLSKQGQPNAKNTRQLSRSFTPEQIEALQNPVKLSFEVTKTLTLTGIVDYLLVTLPPPNALEFLSGRIGFTELRSSIQKADTLSDTIISLINHLKVPENSQTRLVLIEVKRETSGNLLNCIPQVLGEALITLKKSSREELSWILTNGFNWIFGTFKRDTSAFDPGCYTYCMTEAIWQDRSDGQRLELEARAIWRLLSYWASVPPSILHRTLAGRVARGREGS